MYEILPFLWFSMRLGMINIYKICTKYHVMAIKQHLGKNALHLTINTREFYQLFFPQFRSTKHL